MYFEDEVEKPKFKHDCIPTRNIGGQIESGCIFLGNLEGKDIYLCVPDDVELASLIMRYGDEGHEYLSHYASDDAVEFLKGHNGLSN